MVYNFNDLLFIFGASEKSTRVRGGFVSENYSLTIAKGNYAGSFVIYSKDNPSSPVFLELIRNIKSLEHYDKFVKITFRNNSSIRVFRSSETTIDYSDYVNDYAQYNDGIGVLESVIKKDVRIPGTNIMLEKGDRITVKSRIREAYNEDRLAKALGCRSLNFEKLPMNEDLGLLVYDGEKQGVFYLADNSTGSIEFTGLYRDILEAFYDKSGKAGVIRFRDGSSIVIRDLGGFLDIEKRNFESAPERNDKRINEEIRDLLFRATTPDKRYFFEIYSTESKYWYEWRTNRGFEEKGNISNDPMKIGYVLAQITKKGINFDRIEKDELEIKTPLIYLLKTADNQFWKLKDAVEGTPEYDLLKEFWEISSWKLSNFYRKGSNIYKFIDKMIAEFKKVKQFESASKKSNKKNVKETTENVLFRATTRGGKDFFEIKKTTFDDGGTYYDWTSERSGGGGNVDKLPLAEFIGEILTPDVTYDKIVVDNLGIGNLLKNTYKNINSMFGDLKKAPKGSEQHQLWFAVWRGLRKELMLSNKNTVSAIRDLIDRTLTNMKEKINYLNNKGE